MTFALSIRLMLAALLAVPTAVIADEPAKRRDFYEDISVHTLANGMTIVLAPRADARNIEVEVQVNSGWADESRYQLGVAHLVEHLVFRDERLPSDQSYIELIKENAGGNANGVTSWKTTTFHASVPSLKGVWVLNEFSRMLFNRKLDAQHLEKARSEVLLEMGEPHNALQAFLANLNPTNWEQPDFFLSEFGVSGNPAPDEVVRRQTQTLTLTQAQAFYDRHYVPGNMVLLYAGPFKPKETLAFVKETFESIPEKAFDEAEHGSIAPREKPFLRSSVANRDAWISYGTKFWDISAQDEIVLNLYLNYLSHRLMKQLRNVSGETYTVETKLWVDEQRFGYAIVSFETPRDQFQKNLALVKELVQRETREGAFSDDDIAKARALLYSETELTQSGSDAMANLARTLYSFRRTYQTSQTPIQVFETLSNDEIRRRLAELFEPQRAYLALVEPPLLFRGEFIPLFVVVGLLTLLLARWALLKPFDHTAVRYVRKIKYRATFTLGALFVYLNLVWVSCQLASLVDRLLLHSNTIQATFVLSQYAAGALLVTWLLLLTLAFISLIPRKLIVADNHLILKSLTYYSRRFPRTSIRSITACRPHHLFTKRLYRLKPRLFHLSLWQKGILIELKKGQAFYLGFSDADKVIDELQEILGEKTLSGVHPVGKAARG